MSRILRSIWVLALAGLALLTTTARAACDSVMGCYGASAHEAGLAKDKSDQGSMRKALAESKWQTAVNQRLMADQAFKEGKVDVVRFLVAASKDNFNQAVFIKAA